MFSFRVLTIVYGKVEKKSVLCWMDGWMSLKKPENPKYLPLFERARSALSTEQLAAQHSHREVPINLYITACKIA